MNGHRLMVFGGGGAGRNMAKAALASGRTKLVAICESDQSRRRALQEMFPDVAIGADYQELMQSTRPDVAHIATPDHLHYEHALAALRWGCDLLIEKPLATTVADALSLMAEVERQAAVAMVHFSLRFQYPTREALESIKRGEIGAPFLLEGFYVHDLWELYSPESPRHTPWRIDHASPQNVLLGGGCHPIDMILEGAAAPVVEVTAYANGMATPEFPAEDCYAVLMRFANGVLGNVIVSTGVNGVSFPYGYFNAYGTEGTLLKDTIHKRGQAPETLQRSEPDPPSGHNWEASFSGFIDAVEGLRRVPAPLSVSATNVAVCEAAIRSAAAGRPEAPARVPSGHPWGELEHAQLKMRYGKGLEALQDWTAPASYELRPYEPEDDPGLRKLLAVAGFPRMAEDEGYSSLIGQNEALDGTRLITRDSQIVAVAFGGRWTDEIGRFDFVCGHPDHRGHGLGMGACIAVMRYLFAKGYRIVELNTDDWRLPAVRTYLKIGFEPYLYRQDMARRWESVMARLARFERLNAAGQPR